MPHIKPRGRPRQSGTFWPSKKKSLHSKHNKENTVPDKPYQKHLSSVQACLRKEVQTVALDRPPLIEKQDQGNKLKFQRSDHFFFHQMKYQSLNYVKKFLNICNVENWNSCISGKNEEGIQVY